MKVQNLLFLKMLVLLFSAILKKFGGLISNVMSPIESKNPHPLSPPGVKKKTLASSYRWMYHEPMKWGKWSAWVQA